MEERRAAHSVYNINYHLVWCPRYRHAYLYAVEDTLSTAIVKSIDGTGIELLSEHIAGDHVHLFVSAPPTEAPCDIVRRIKSISARRLWDEHAPLMKELYWGGGCWERAYYVGTAGEVSAAISGSTSIARSMCRLRTRFTPEVKSRGTLAVYL